MFISFTIQYDLNIVDQQYAGQVSNINLAPH